jgi:DnaK suppressor protein
MSRRVRKDIDFDALKARLVEERDELIRAGEADEESRRPVELDQTRLGRLSRMDALQAQAMAIETDRRRGVETNRIEAALKRFENGEFGYCLSCDVEIPAKRLKFDPATPFCVDCAGDAGSGH